MSDVLFRILRDRLSTDGPTMGKLYAGHLALETIELPWKGNAPMISCIPSGSYHVAMTYSNRFKGPMPEILDVPGRTGIRLHPAHQASNVEGCVGTGLERDTPVTIVGQVPAFGQFYSWLEATLLENRAICIVGYADGSTAP